MVISALQNRRKSISAKSKARLATDQETQDQMAEIDAAIGPA